MGEPKFYPVFAETSTETVECVSCGDDIPPGNKVCWAEGEQNPVCEDCIDGWNDQALYQETPPLPPYKFVKTDWRKQE